MKAAHAILASLMQGVIRESVFLARRQTSQFLGILLDQSRVLPEASHERGRGSERTGFKHFTQPQQVKNEGIQRITPGTSLLSSVRGKPPVLHSGLNDELAKVASLFASAR
jgi:hypothetical protein